MRVTIIPIDSFMAVDGEGYHAVDLSFMDPNIHALQWYDTEGELEIKNNRGRVVENRAIDSLEPYAAAFESWEAAKTAWQAAQQAAQQAALEAEPTQTEPSEG
jgi:hypothetical protein